MCDNTLTIRRAFNCQNIKLDLEILLDVDVDCCLSGNWLRPKAYSHPPLIIGLHKKGQHNKGLHCFPLECGGLRLPPKVSQVRQGFSWLFLLLLWTILQGSLQWIWKPTNQLSLQNPPNLLNPPNQQRLGGGDATVLTGHYSFSPRGPTESPKCSVSSWNRFTGIA